jgi:hypothetical protein
MEVHIQQHHVGTEISETADQFVRRWNDFHLSEMDRQKQLQSRSDAAVIVYNQYLSFTFCHRNHLNPQI